MFSFRILSCLKNPILESQFSIATTTSALEQRHHRQRLPSTSFRSRSRSRSSSGTRSPSVQHQPEFTAEGYRIDLPLSVFDGFGTSQSAGNNSLLRLDIGTEDGRGKKKDDTSDDEGTGSGKKKKEKKKRGYFGMEDIDLKSPTKLKPGVVRPFAESEEEDDEEGSDQEEVREMDMAGGPSTSPITPQPKKIHSGSLWTLSLSTSQSAFESQLPDFTLDEDAFDPQRISTQRRSALVRVGAAEMIINTGTGTLTETTVVITVKETEMVPHPTVLLRYSTKTAQSTFVVSKMISLVRRFIFLAWIRRRRRGRGVREAEEEEEEDGVLLLMIMKMKMSIVAANGDGSQSQSQFQSQALEGFGYGYCSQMDVDGAADRVSRFVDGDVSS
ncbi:hypothetical protein BT96DRAFT_696761 [Gymnopus androsaceus JB14]|uniref:Uncharacterized protein n=1 Tax=Gymnopus androsaceus JB14 TaxID=1447944 RepID=A0A6A4I8G5_9AGAR|nr:hypothetical protein BT96DRAFT_696761 [Gymnopus androsaceus JB14]